MNEGWLWLSILNTQACPSPISMTPAFSPGPWITHGALVGRLRRCTREDLYEQCSFHIAEKMPSSVKLGVRPISLRMRSYSSGLSPCAAISAGVIFTALAAFGLPLGLAFACLVGDGRALAFCSAGAFRPVRFRDVLAIGLNVIADAGRQSHHIDGSTASCNFEAGVTAQ